MRLYVGPRERPSDVPRFSITYTSRDAPYGGANQFFQALKGALGRAGVSVAGDGEPNVILFNSHHDLDRVADARRENPNAVFIHRVDGPMRLYNGLSDTRDSRVTRANRWFADATLFQSEWSRRANEELGFKPAAPIAVIGNASEPLIFNRERVHPPLSGPKVRLIATSWSSNLKKGFDVYEYLDRTLDFSRFEMTFVGNTPLAFRNVHHIPPCSPAELASHLKESDIFVTGSQSDPCSNSLIEALQCGLPAVARRDGGHPEIVGNGGELFNEMEEVPEAVNRVVSAYRGYAERIALPDIDEIARRYLHFAETLLTLVSEGRLKPRRLGAARRLAWRIFGFDKGAA